MVASGDAALRKAVGRACQQVLGKAFSSALVPVSGAAHALYSIAPTDQSGMRDGEDAQGGGVDAMQVDHDNIGSWTSAAAVNASVEPPYSGDGHNMQAMLCSLLRLAVVVAGSPAAAAAAVAAGNGTGAAAAAGAAASAAAAGAAAAAASAATTTKTTGPPSSSSDAVNARGSGNAAAAPAAASALPMLLEARHWRTEDGEDPDEEEVSVPDRAALQRKPDSAALAEAVAAAEAGFSAHLPSRPPSSGVASSGATATIADPFSSELLQSVMALLLGGGRGGVVGRDGGGPSRAVPRRSSSTKEKDGARDSTGSKAKQNASKPSQPGASEVVDAGAKKRARSNTGGGGGNNASVSSAPHPNVAEKVLFMSPAEGLTRLNLILRTPSLAVLASVLQLATVR